MSKHIFPWLQQRLLKPLRLNRLSAKLGVRRSTHPRLAKSMPAKTMPAKTLQQLQALSAHAVYQQRAKQRQQQAQQQAHQQQLNYKPINNNSVGKSPGYRHSSENANASKRPFQPGQFNPPASDLPASDLPTSDLPVSNLPATDKISEKVAYSVSRAETVDTLNKALSKNHQIDKTQAQRRTTKLQNKQCSNLAPLINSIDVAYLSELKGDDLEAERLYQQGLNSYKAKLGPHHPKVAEPLRSLANLYYKQNRHTQAEALLLEALSIHQAAIAESVGTGETLHALAILYRDQKQYGKADTCFQKALTIFRQQLGSEHAQTQAAYGDLMTMMANLIEQDQFTKLAVDLPPLDLNTLGETYSWARPFWQQQ